MAKKKQALPTTRSSAAEYLEQRFPEPDTIVKESDKKEFTKLFGEYLRVENILQNYDEFASLKALQTIDMNDPQAVEAFKAQHYLDDDDLAALQDVKLPPERQIQDYKSTYKIGRAHV